MLTGDIKNQVDRIWDAFWSGGISNPLEVIEQITYLLFIRRLDDLHTLEENKANRLKRPMERRIFPKGKDAKGRSYEDYRWSRFQNLSPAEMFTVVGEHVFPFLRTDLARQLGDGDSTYTQHMKDARFTIPTAALLSKVVDLLAQVPMAERDTKGDVYEYMLAKIASAGQNGQFRTPRHIIRLMVELTAPQPTDVICDPLAEVAVEVARYSGDDNPALAWARQHPEAVEAVALDVVAEVLAQVSEVLDADKEGVEEADCYVLALAFAAKGNGDDARIVTEEFKTTVSKMPLGSAAGYLGVPSVSQSSGCLVLY